MRNLRSSMKANGYDGEEAYFYAREQELIKKMRDGKAPEPGPTLLLLTGGRREEPTQKPQSRQIEKAA